MNQKAPVGLRIISGIIDALVLILAYVLVLYFLSVQNDTASILNGLVMVVFLVVLVVPLALYLSSLLLISKAGGTIGKLVTGTRIVGSNGELISLTRAFFRNHVGYFASNLFFGLGFIWIAIDKDRRGWHDMIADTFVVVKTQTGYLTGSITLLLFLFANIFFITTSFTNYQNHLPIYQNIMTDVARELNKLKKDTLPDTSPLPKPAPTPEFTIESPNTETLEEIEEL
ncbi:RDD family protein [Candidatus Gottesmanbacteria bacterium]|nr:RDD family protein [Candidatus Gottesmanbacteria bacterium]